ncbi:MAG: hypothetical protein NT039_01605 [Candidatus Berkelbacteria bacterium]|nr:hypothetical protein [Candidatus Berkelbacteria bacterium]
MEKLKNIVKSKSAKIFAILFVAMLLVFSFAPSINADGPIFNGLPDDQKLISGVNATQHPGSTDWTDPVSGNSGDTVDVLVYYHNIVEGTTAKNTRISVILPSGEKTTQVLSAKLWATNADAVRDTLTINSGETVKVDYIPGSTVWFPNRQGNSGGTGQPLPDGITTANGVSIGGIQGCWQYAGYVLFQVRLMHTPTPPPTHPNIAIEKYVSKTNLGNGIYDWKKEVEADRGEEVAFRLSFNNDGDAAAQNVIVKDVLPAGLAFVPGSGTLHRSNGNAPVGEELFTDGVSIGTFGRGESAYIIFKARAADVHILEEVLVNTGIITAAGGLRDEDQARVIVKIPAVPEIEKSKNAWNITQNVDATTIPAKEGDVIEYHLITKNIGNGTQMNFIVDDDLSDVLDNAQIISISNNGSMQGNTIVYPKVDLAAGQRIDYTFKVKVTSQRANSDLEMRNIYGNWVIIIIEKRPPVIQNPHLTIEKLVRNVTLNETTYVKENNAKSGDTLEYKMVIQNDGDSDALNVTLRDVLPLPVSYVAGSLSITLPNGQVVTPVELFNQNIILGNLRQNGTTGETITVIFRAKVNSEIACGSRIENKVVTTASGNLRADSFAYTDVVCENIPTPTPQVKGMTTLTSTGTPLETLAIVALVIMAIGSAIVIYKYGIK